MKAIRATAWLVALFAASLLTPEAGRAQETRTMNVTQIERLFAAGVGAAQILQTAREACIDFRIDAAIEDRLQKAGANAEFITALRQVCVRGVTPPVQPQPQPQPQRTTTTPPPATQLPRYSPGSALTRSLIVPGLGQFYTGRPLLGALFLAGWGGALGFGLMTQEVTIECLERVTGACPPNQIRGEVVRRPMLAIGAGAALAIAALSAVEANAAAKRANRAGPGNNGANPESLEFFGVTPLLNAQPDGALAVGLHLRIR